MPPPTRQNGGAAHPAVLNASRHQATGQRDRSAGDRQDEADDFAVPCPVSYGVDRLDTDQWLDQDGAVYSGRGPYERRLTRRLRRALRRWVR